MSSMLVRIMKNITAINAIKDAIKPLSAEHFSWGFRSKPKNVVSAAVARRSCIILPMNSIHDGITKSSENFINFIESTFKAGRKCYL